MYSINKKFLLEPKLTLTINIFLNTEDFYKRCKKDLLATLGGVEGLSDQEYI